MKVIAQETFIYDEQRDAVECWLVVVKKDFVKTNFTHSGYQGRVVKQESVIKDIIHNFKPDLMIGHSGSFQGLPIIDYQGQVLVGNHRAEALKEMNRAQYKAVSQNFKKTHGFSLKYDEIPVRMVGKSASKEILQTIAFISNKGRECTLGEKVITATEQYAQQIEKLPVCIIADNVNALAHAVAFKLDKQNHGLNSFDANYALFCHIAKESKEELIQAFDRIQRRDAKTSANIQQMLVMNAGLFYNLSQNKHISFNLCKYLARAVSMLSIKKGTKTQNCASLAKTIYDFQIMSSESKKAKLALDPDFVEYVKANAFAISLLKFLEQNNASEALFEFLSEFLPTLEQKLAPSLMSAGKSLREATIYDALILFLSQGRINSEVSILCEKILWLEQYELGNVVENTKILPSVAKTTKVEKQTKKTESKFALQVKDIMLKQFGNIKQKQGMNCLPIYQPRNKVNLKEHSSAIIQALQDKIKGLQKVDFIQSGRCLECYYIA